MHYQPRRSVVPTAKASGGEGGGGGGKQNKTWPQEVLNPLLHFLSPQAPLHSLTLPCVVSPSRLGRDLVTFECPIKRRGSVRAPLLVPFRHVTDEQAAIFPILNHTRSDTGTPTHSSHPLILFHAYFPRLFCLFFFFCTNTLPSLVKDPPPV